jgi:class 3 adenylate cyclase
MESHGAPGRVQISASTKALLDGAFAIEERGSIEVKGKGAMVTYWLNAGPS